MFDNTIRERGKRSFWEAHQVLDSFSIDGLSGSSLSAPQSVELAVLRVLSMSARDTYRLTQEKVSTFEQPDGLADAEIRIAGVAMGRHDIGLLDSNGNLKGAEKNKPLRFTREDGFAFTVINDQADEQYDRQVWEEARLKHLDRCIEKRANIVCMGEFDFPPYQDGVDDTEFLNSIQAKIGALPFPMFVVFGTRHEKRGNPPTCKNVAKIIVNNELKNLVSTHRPKEYAYDHNKTVAATKVGEIISPPSEIEAKYYDTKLGRIAVLICVDAYNPTLIFSLIDAQLYQRYSHKKQIPDRLDFILVPSYNFSPKLYYACQVLSLICKSTVLLVDASCNWTESGYNDMRRKEIELFVNGRAFTDIRTETPEIGEMITGENDEVHAWSLNRHYLTASRATLEENSPTPNFDTLREYIDEI